MRTARRRASYKRKILLLIACVILSAATFAGTLAYILTNTSPLTNQFSPAQMSCEIQENFSDGITKKNVSVKNTSDAPAYIRVKLLPYWYDNRTDTIVAKSAWDLDIPSAEGWKRGEDGYYYCISPVDPGDSTPVLISSLTLDQDDVSLARQVLEIIASCVQAEPADAVMAAWSGANGSVTGVASDTLAIQE